MTDAPDRIWADSDNLTWVEAHPDENMKRGEVLYLRADLVPRWSDDMDAAPKDGSRVLTFHPANPKAIIERARRDNIVWNAVKAGQWWYSLPEQPPTHWMRIAPPKEGE